MHPDTKYVQYTECLEQKEYYLTGVSRGATKKERGMTNAHSRLRIYHPDSFNDLMKHEGRVADADGASGDMTHHFAVAPKSRGPSCQIKSVTLDSLARLVVESPDPWDRINSTTLHNFAKSIYPHAWVPSVKTLLDHARIKATVCHEKILGKIQGEVLSVALDNWMSAAGD